MALLRAVQNALQRFAPPALAGSWDNTGTLINLEPKASAKTCLLCIDLTRAVLDAAPQDTGVIIAYHPPIFSGLKSLSRDVALQESLIQCIQRGIAVYSPHSALDGCIGGINDFLASGLGQGSTRRIKEKIGIEGQLGAGEGLILELQEAVSIEDLIARVKSHLNLKTVMLARNTVSPAKNINSIGICAGSGGSTLATTNCDCWLTGELSHHEILAAVARGTSCILTNHSNTERPYLRHIAPLLEQLINESKDSEVKDTYKVEVSIADRDPLEFI